MNLTIVAIPHECLSSADVEELSRLFDNEYLQVFGPWDLDLPYGYAPHEVHIIARLGERIIGHVGWARRVITVGSSEVVIAGTGGVLVAPEARGKQTGAELMQFTAQSMSDHGGIEFGYLGCREEVVPFYTKCGWTRITACESWVGRSDEPIVSGPGDPIMILPLAGSDHAWPAGDIDLHGRAW